MVIFYTCMTGEHGFIPDITNEKRKDFKYICFHENHPEAELDKGWDYVNLATDFDNSEHNLSDQKRQRMVKMLPHIFLPNHVYSIYLDPSYYVNKSFYDKCYDYIKKDVNFGICNRKRTFKEEIKQAYDNHKISSLEEYLVIKDYYKKLPKDRSFYSTNGSWIIRKKRDSVNTININWYKLFLGTYKERGLDQLLLPLVSPKKSIFFLDEKDLYDNCFEEPRVVNYEDPQIDKSLIL